MGLWSSITDYIKRTDPEEDVFILPPGGGSPGGIDARDIREIHDEIYEEMDEEGALDIDEYAEAFQTRGQDRSDYGALSRDILLDMDKDFDFVAEYSLLFEEKLDEKIEYLNSDGYDDWRIHRYNFVEMPEEDMRGMVPRNQSDSKERHIESN